MRAVPFKMSFRITSCVAVPFSTNRVAVILNASRAIQNLGGQSTVFYLALGLSGQMFGVSLDWEGLKHLAIPIGDWTRENFTVTEDAQRAAISLHCTGTQCED